MSIFFLHPTYSLSSTSDRKPLIPKTDEFDRLLKTENRFWLQIFHYWPLFLATKSTIKKPNFPKNCINYIWWMIHIDSSVENKSTIIYRIYKKILLSGWNPRGHKFVLAMWKIVESQSWRKKRLKEDHQYLWPRSPSKGWHASILKPQRFVKVHSSADSGECGKGTHLSKK